MFHLKIFEREMQNNNRKGGERGGGGEGAGEEGETLVAFLSLKFFFK